jgi:hypothetical protein
MAEMKNSYNFFFAGKIEGKRKLARPNVDGRIILE